jgi:predicted O-linked N-acetylglucosamine transferase (SPINDLY family)
VNVSKNRNEHIIQNLMTIRDYEYTKNFITKKYENGEQIINYYMRKIGLFFLMGNSEKIEFEINAIIDIINDFGTLEKLYYLIVSSTININIKKKICIKLLKSGISEHITHKIMESVYSSIIKVDLNENELYELIEITDYFISNNILQEYQHVLNILSLHIRNHITNTKLHEKFKKITNINIDADTLYSIDEIEVLLNNKKISIEYLYSLISNFDPYYKSYEKMCKKRKLIKDLIDYLCEKEIKQYTLDTIVLLHPNNFYLSYQGLSSKDIFMARSKLMRKICENLNFKIDTNFNNKKINICFHSNFLSRTHSVYKDRHQVIKYLSNDERFNVYFTTFDPLDEKVRDTFGKAKHIKLPINLTKIKELLTNLKLDYLVYCEIGMCPLTYYVAHMKLAKKQYVTWGHSDTSGIDTIDCFISSKYYELEYEKSQENYSEKLILLNSLCTYYINPAEKYKMHKFKNRNHYGFTNEYKIFFCAQSAFKLNIIFIDYLIEIMEKNPTAILIFSKNEFVDKHLELLENKNISFRIHYYPNQSHYDYMNLIYISDIVLDPFPFGGCNSSLESFSLNKPIVTQASNMINGRFTSGFYKKMQMDDMINNSRIEYINMVQKLVNNEEFYNECSLSINNKKHLLFEDNETLEDWKNLFIKESS